MEEERKSDSEIVDPEEEEAELADELHDALTR